MPRLRQTRSFSGAGWMTKWREVCRLSLAAMVFASALASSACNKQSVSLPSPPPEPAPPPPSAVTVFPGSASIPINQKIQFSAFLPSNPAAAFTWSVSGGGTIDSSTGLYTAPQSVPTPATATVTATGSNATGTATINIASAQGLVVGTEVVSGGTVQLNQVGPSAVVLAAGATQNFNALAGGLHQMPTWEVNGNVGGDPADGTIAPNPVTGDGVYSSPLTPPPSGSVVITALSGADAGTASVTVVFSDSSLSGQYAFSYAGKDSSGFLAVVGSFTANAGTGMVTGIEDYNSKSLKTPATAVPFAGPFSVNPDGSGTATVTPTGANPPISGATTLQFVLISNPQGGTSPHGQLVRFDKAATGSGTIDQQNPTQFLLSAISGNYVFLLQGLNTSGQGLQIAGKFQADGFGTIPVNEAEEDINNDGTNTSAAPDTTLNGTYKMDALSPGSGRGTVQLINTSTQLPGTFDFAFYIVDGTHLKVVETDTNAYLEGDFFSAPNINGSFSGANLKGSYAFMLSGADVTNVVPFLEGGIFNADGTSSITSGILDINDGGLSLTLDTALSAESYSVDPNLGRISLSISTTGVTATNFAGYTTSSGAVLLIRLDSSVAAGGIGYLRSGSPTIQGSFSLNFSGATNTGGFPGEHAAGRIIATGNTNPPSGSLYLNDAGTLASGAALTSTSVINSPDSNGRGTATIGTSSTEFSLAYYIVDDNTVLVIEANATRIIEGTLIRQF